GGGLSFTEAGRALRQQVEDQTDESATGPYASLGPDGCENLRRLGRPLSQAMVDAGLLHPPADRFGE
ncbi:MAG: hypothetical protein M3R71_00605, partial [Actinomycetota bacterium]|nr:hypothetical protein [Actinomycetota bacterium]